MTDLRKLDIFYSNFLDESLDFWGYTREFLCYTPDILEYANETHFIHLVTHVLTGVLPDTFIPICDLQREFISENKVIIDQLYSLFYNFMYDLNKKLNKDCSFFKDHSSFNRDSKDGSFKGIIFHKEFFYYWCFSFS